VVTSNSQLTVEVCISEVARVNYGNDRMARAGALVEQEGGARPGNCPRCEEAYIRYSRIENYSTKERGTMEFTRKTRGAVGVVWVAFMVCGVHQAVAGGDPPSPAVPVQPVKADTAVAAPCGDAGLHGGGCASGDPGFDDY
jgi:hypothetical protein